MAAKFIITPGAARDLRSIQDYLSAESPAASERVGAELYTAFAGLARWPGSGHARPDLTDQPVKFWKVYSYLVVYDPESRPIRIIRVVHGARDLSRLLNPPDPS